MKENKEPILILLILFVLLGLAYKPLQNSKGNRAFNLQPNSSAISTDGGSSGYSQNKDTAETIKETEKNIKKLEADLAKKTEEGRRSPYYGKIRMSNISGIYSTDPSEQYISLYTSLSNTETVNITGWYLKSEVTGYYAVIGKASLLPFPFTKTESDVVLADGDSVVLTKGFSPIGISFRTNICTGYFEENRTFIPSLPRECPRAKDEKLPTFSSVYDRNDECIDVIKSIPRCTTKNSEFLRDLPDTVPELCKNYITAQINYNACVAKHFGDTKFPGHEYRIFLNKFGPLWRPEREKINLHDRNGLIVDTISY
jgi:hypothetical protein